jgi:hypothetical protein
MNIREINKNERGGARAKLILFLAVFAIVLYAGYLYVPVSIDAYYYKDIMQNMVNQAAAQGSDPNWLKDQLLKNAPDYHVPPDATIEVSTQNKVVNAHVKFTRPIVTPVYTYNYEFDHSVTSSTFLTK